MSLEPHVLIKIVDACNSGIPYIKDSGNYNSPFLFELKNEIPDCFFLSSSRSNQKSFASAAISDFTKAAADAIIERKIEEFRVYDLKNFLADKFQNSKQKPYFVMQGSENPILGNFDDSSKNKISNLITEIENTQSLNQPTEDHELAANRTTDDEKSEDTIESVAPEISKRKVTKEEALETLTTLKDFLTEGIKNDQKISLNYSQLPYFSQNYFEIPNPSHIGTWLNKNPEKAKFFADVVFTQELVDNHDGDPYLNLMLPSLFRQKQKQKKTVIKSVETHVTSLPFVAHDLLLKPIDEIQNQLSACLTFLLSKDTIACFYCFTEYKEIDWGVYKPSSSTVWQLLERNLTQPDLPKFLADTFHSEFSKWVTERLQ